MNNILKLTSLVMFYCHIHCFAQLSSTGFEGLSDESVFNLSSWTAQGFTVPWVNGFNQNRAYIDNAFARSGNNSLRITYPANQFGPGNSGAQAPLMVTPVNQLYMSYWVRFSDNFDYGGTSEGGKLPGLGGGGRCSGCNVCDGTNGFTARLMWRTGGRLVLYLYHLDKSNPPCGDNNTLVVGGADYYVTKGQWFQVTQRVKVNSGSNHDGEVELWINGQPALLRTGIQFVTNGNKVDNLYFSTFHGGSTAAWSPGSDVHIWFDDIKISTNPSDIFQPLGISTDTNMDDTSEGSNDVFNSFMQPLSAGQSFSFKYADESGYEVEWFDIRGKFIEKCKINSDLITVPQLKSGIYIIKFRHQGNWMARKIWVEN